MRRPVAEEARQRGVGVGEARQLEFGVGEGVAEAMRLVEEATRLGVAVG